MRVVIVGKTKMHGGVCIGGLVEDTGQSVRLIPRGQYCHPLNTPFELGDIWELAITPRQNATPPHVEDHDVDRTGSRVGQVANLNEWLRECIEPWVGDRTSIFGGTAEFRDNGTAYVPEQGPLPNHSTGFWLLPNKMVYDPFVKADGNVPYYVLPGKNSIKLKYVGFLPTAELPKHLAAGTLVRLSLAHLWTNAPDPANRDKFFVQLSGWFE